MSRDEYEQYGSFEEWEDEEYEPYEYEKKQAAGNRAGGNKAGRNNAGGKNAGSCCWILLLPLGAVVALIQAARFFFR